jgi:flavoprotein
MTRDDYYNMAVASGLWQSKPIYDTALMAIDLMRFVDMVRTHECEACAKLCEQKSAVKGGEIFAARIRARGEHEASR